MVGILLFVISLSMLAILKYCEKDHKESNKETSNIDTDIMNLEMEMVAYGHSVLNFIELQTEDVNKMIDNNDSFFLYIGRITCQWCRRMVPVLNKIAENEHIEIYYLDSEETESNSLLSEFREKYEIETVPAILSFDEYGDY